MYMNNKKKIYIFLLLLPFIDLITSLITRFDILNISLGIVVKGIFLLIMIYYLLINSFSKYKKKSIIYLIIIFIYMILYFLTKIRFITIENLIQEIMYMFKIMYLPMLFPCLLCYFDDKKISKKELIYVLSLTAIIYAILLALPILTNSSFKTYDSSLQGNTGWFFSGNEISIIMVILFPFIYNSLERKRIYYMIIPLIVVLIVSTIGTKASMIGLLIDSLLIFIFSFFKKYKKSKRHRLILSAFIIFVFTGVVFINSKSLNNLKITLGIQQVQDKAQLEKDREKERKRLQERRLIREEIKKLEVDSSKEKETMIMKFYNNYGKALLSDRDIYFKITYKLYEKDHSINTFLFGLGYTNNEKIDSFAITKLIEIDPLDIYFHSGIVAFIIIFMPFIYYFYNLFRQKKINNEIILNILVILMILAISCASGHTLMAPAVSIYILLYLLISYSNIGLINEKKENINKGNVTIYALHLNYGGVEKNISMKANILSKIYNVEIISLYKINEPKFDLNEKVKIKYLTQNIKPNKKEFLDALKDKKIIKIFKEGFYSLKVLYLKNVLLRKSMTNCNSEIIISTRVDFTLKLLQNNEYNNIKVAEEHIYHNNNLKYLNKLYRILKTIDYLMPSSKYLCEYYKDIFNDYSYKIITNNMPIETNNEISTLKNKTIISVGRLDKVKGYDDLIKLFAKSNYNDWTLNIVGDGPEYNNLRLLIKKLNMENNIKLLGFKSPKELNKLYKESSIYIMTSLEESFGLVLIEAASHGLPILAYSSALGAKEILKSDRGILIDNRDESLMIKKLNEMINDINLRKEYQQKSISISEEYSYEKIEKDTIHFFKNIKKSNMYMNLYTDTKSNCYKLIENILKNNERKFVVTANPETYMLSNVNKTINHILYDENNLIVPDGISIVKTANFLGYDIKERITGVDLAEHLLKIANKNKYKVFLFGASKEVIEKLENVIEKEYSNIDLVGATNGFVKDKDAIMEYMKLAKPDIILVALGIPLQEKLIYNHINDFEKGIFVGVGGSFDVLSGTKKRAPKILIKFNLEWLYRILKEPKRLMRFMKHNMRFIIIVIKEKLYRNVDK